MCVLFYNNNNNDNNNIMYKKKQTNNIIIGLENVATALKAKFVQRLHARETLHCCFGRNSCGGLTLRISRPGRLPLQKKKMKKFIDSIGKLASTRFN